MIFGNPPYSAGQKSENDNAANVSYPHLDQRIRETYAARSKARLSKALYDPYIRAFRWGTDRLAHGAGGIMAFVSNAGRIDGNAMDGLRKCFAEDFSSIYIFHLRGNQRTQGETSRREGGKVFGGGSRAPIAITIFVQNPNSSTRGEIRFCDIGDYLSREQKLDVLQETGSVSGIEARYGWKPIIPNEHADWLAQRDDSFNEFIAIADKDGVEPVKLFENFSQGILSARDAWCYNSSRTEVASNMRRMLATYEAERQRYIKTTKPVFENSKQREAFIDAFVIADSTRISWSGNLKAELGRQRELHFDDACVIQGFYRPFQRQWMYLNRRLNERVYQIPRIFPSPTSINRVIAVSGNGARSGFSALMVDSIPNFDMIEKGQSFPMFVYEASNGEDETSLFQTGTMENYCQREAITDEGLECFRMPYSGEQIAKEDLFYYIYGLFHSGEFRARFGDNLSKQLPRVPRVTSPSKFWEFTKAGRALARLHVNYEDADPYPVGIKEGDLRLANIPDPASYFRVEKMKFGGRRGAMDKSTVIYNSHITMENIPIEAYDYVVNGRSALEWVIERQCVKTDPASGIVNDANRYANETADDPAYPLKLFQRIITVSLETMKIVRGLPSLGDLT